MIRFSQSQLDAMFPVKPEEFLDFATDHVMEECAASVGELPRDIVREMTDNGLARAKGWGLATPKALLAFVVLMWEIGPDFDQEPAIRAALSQGSGTPDDRFWRMIDEAPDEAWENAELNADDEAWYPELKTDPELG